MPQRQLSTEDQAMGNGPGIMLGDAPSATAAPAENKPRAGDTVDFAEPTPSSAQPPLQSLNTVEGRLRTFRNWKVNFLTAKEMAEAGFAFLDRDDAVECVFCGVVISRWQEGDKAMEEHRRWAPECDFANPDRRLCVDAVSYDSCRPFDPPLRGRQAARPRARLEVTPVHATRAAWPQYCAVRERRASYRDWPPSIPVKPDALSAAGFFYTGVGDRTACYYCGRGLRDWEAGDDPWLEHELWFPGCWHVLLHKGAAFVEAVAAQRDALIAAKKSSREALKQLLLPPATAAAEPPPRAAPADGDGESGATEEKRLCKICFQNEMSVVFLPCGHIVACVDCALSCQYCPVCREPFQNVARVYLP